MFNRFEPLPLAIVPRSLNELLSRFKQGASQILDRSEFDPRISRDTIVFLTGMVVLLLVVTIIAVAVADLLGQQTVASYLLFLLPFIAFVGTVLLTWEILRYRFALRSATDEGERSSVEPGVGNWRDIFYLITSIVLGVIALVIVLQLLTLVT